MAETLLDTRGLNCPLPVLRARMAMQQLASGSLVRILASDPGTVKDFKAFCRATGHELLESQEQEGEFHFVLRKT